MSDHKQETKCIQSGYRPETGEPRVLPIYQRMTYAYDSADLPGDLFDLKTPGQMYSRISNPTVTVWKRKLPTLPQRSATEEVRDAD